MKKFVTMNSTLTLKKLPAAIANKARTSTPESRLEFLALKKADRDRRTLVIDGVAYDLQGNGYQSRAERDAVYAISTSTLNYRADKGVEFKESVKHTTAYVVRIPDVGSFQYAPMMFMAINKQKLNKLQMWNTGFDGKHFHVTGDPQGYNTLTDVFGAYRVPKMWGDVILNMGFTLDEILLPLKYDIKGADRFQKVVSIPGVTRGRNSYNSQKLANEKWANSCKEMYEILANKKVSCVPYVAIYTLMFTQNLTCEAAINAYVARQAKKSRKKAHTEAKYGWDATQKRFVNPVYGYHGHEVFDAFKTMCEDFHLTPQQVISKMKKQNMTLSDVLHSAAKDLRKKTPKQKAVR